MKHCPSRLIYYLKCAKINVFMRKSTWSDGYPKKNAVNNPNCSAPPEEKGQEVGAICNGYQTEWSPTWSVIIRMMTK